MNYNKSLVVAVALLLSACQTIPGPVLNPESGWRRDEAYFDATKLKLEALKQWRYTAKIGITTPVVREVANMVWEFSDQSNDIRLFGPLGIGAVNLQFDQYGVMLSDNSGAQHRGHSAQDLLTDIVGWPIPIDALSSWLHVLPDSTAVYRYKLNQAATELTTLEQLGWQIKYSSYRLYGGGDSAVMRPRKITATKVLPDKSKLIVKLVSKSWAF